nr:unnamed protein product [Spirometra erinaceieuropaei]
MEEFLLCDQGCLRFTNQSNCSSSQGLRQYSTHRENKTSSAMSRALRQRPQLPSTIFHATIARLPQVKTKVDLDIQPSLHQTIRLVQQLTSRKTPGSNALSADIYKRDGP